MKWAGTKNTDKANVHFEISVDNFKELKGLFQTF
jgi:hypothetical protein